MGELANRIAGQIHSEAGPVLKRAWVKIRLCEDTVTLTLAECRALADEKYERTLANKKLQNAQMQVKIAPKGSLDKRTGGATVG